MIFVIAKLFCNNGLTLSEMIFLMNADIF